MAGRRDRKSVEERRTERAAIDDPAIVLDAAARFLEARPRSMAEVRRRLGRAGYRAELVEGAIARLIELGMLDDAAFAAQWVESRDRAHPRGEHALIVELRQMGIDAQTIAATLRARRDAAARWDGEAPPPVDGPPPNADQAAARKLLARHARTIDRIADPRARRQRAYALLARNGFDPETCRSTSAEIGRDPDPEVPGEDPDADDD